MDLLCSESRNDWAVHSCDRHAANVIESRGDNGSGFINALGVQRNPQYIPCQTSSLYALLPSCGHAIACTTSAMQDGIYVECDVRRKP
eukprot:6369380-Amphidinium_carterae.1